LDAFVRLSPRNRVRVIPAVFTKPKVKGPIVRCIPTDSSKKDSLEVANVDSVDKVYRILTRHMRVSGVNAMARECLKFKFQGNSHLEENEPSRAIEAYDRALGTNFTEEQGIILLNRATAYLQMAAGHKKELQELVVDLAKSVPDLTTLQFLYEEAAMFPALSGSMFQRVVSDTKMQDRKFRKIKHRHGLYQYSLLHAAQDGLRATQLLPTYAKSWLRAGEILSELWKLNESAKYYEKAIELDSSLEGSLSPVVERLRKRQELLTSARAYGWSEDTLRLALDVAG
jgi:tetratricopeptide (TPR) repeat protein